MRLQFYVFSAFQLIYTDKFLVLHKISEIRVLKLVSAKSGRQSGQAIRFT
jgi:hypothetical protein